MPTRGSFRFGGVSKAAKTDTEYAVQLKGAWKVKSASLIRINAFTSTGLV